jgi:LPS O-antigen subunit length determinant protein (WzzB/FepE family)
VELEASTKLKVEKWTTSFKKTPTSTKSIEDLKTEVKMLRCLAKLKKSMSSDYKHTIMNLHCANRSDEILENEDEQMRQFCLEAGLSLEQLHGQSDIEMTSMHKAWEVGEPMTDEKHFDNSTQT